MLDLISYGGLYQCIGTLWNRVIYLSRFNHHPLLTDTGCCWNIGSWIFYHVLIVFYSIFFDLRLSCDKCLYSYSVLSKFVVVWVHCTAHNLLWLCIVLHRFPLWKKLAFIEERSTPKITAFIKERSKIIILYGSLNIGAWAKFTHLSTPELKDCLTEERKQCPRLVRIVIFSILLFSLKATFTVLLRLLLSLLFVDNINSEMDFANRMCILR